MNQIILSIANQKGGVGKTTSAVTLAHGLAREGYRTLLVDLDGQGHVGHMFNLPKIGKVRQWFYDNQSLASLVVQARENLSVLTSDKGIEKVKGKIRDESYGEIDFVESLKDQTTQYDAVILDMAPGLDVLHVAGLMASDFVIIPTRLFMMDLDGVSEILRTIKEVERHGHSIKGTYFLPTFYDRTTTETFLRLKELYGLFGKAVWPPIMRDIKAAEAPGHSLTLWEYSPNCNAIRGYQENGGKRIGGYLDTLERLKNLIEGL